MYWDALDTAAEEHGLFLMGALHDGDDTLALLGGTPALWLMFCGSAEARDGTPDPLDRWSERIMGDLATRFDAVAEFPFGGPPYAPFIAWALATGRFWQSPTGMLVHDVAGLMVSLRGALRLPGQRPLPENRSRNPCDTCAEKPCTNACPVDALSDAHAYDVPACKAWLRMPEGRDCMDLGCRVRRACPVSQRFARNPAQSAFHMQAFLGADGGTR